MIFSSSQCVAISTSLSRNILSKVFAISSTPTVRQEIRDAENDWQEWKIKDEKDTERVNGDGKNSSNSEEIKSDECKKLRPIQLPDIQSLSYMSDGDELNVTLWLSKIYSEEVYEDILKSETFSDISEISSDSFSSSSQSSNLSRSVQFVMVVDIVSVLDEGIDYTMELSSPKYDNPYWPENIYEISAFGNKKLVYTKTFDTFPYNDKNFIEFSIDLELLGNPDKYKLLFYIIDKYPVNGEDCRIVDISNWSLIPTPEFNIVPAISNIEIRPPEEKNIIIKLNTNSDLHSTAVLGVNYTNEEEEKININFEKEIITISPYSNNSVILNIVGDEQFEENKVLPIKILANISFPQTVTNRGGDIYYSNQTISIPTFSELTLTILKPLTLNEHIDNFIKFIEPWRVHLVALGGAIFAFLKKKKVFAFLKKYGIFTIIRVGIHGFFAFLSKRRNDKQGSIANLDDYTRK